MAYTAIKTICPGKVFWRLFLTRIRSDWRLSFPAMLDWNQCQVVERGRVRSKPIWRFKGTQVSATLLFENLEDGATINDFLEWYPGVTREQVLAVLEFAERSLVDGAS
jgi:uncharacterized protein (DUF433 family)